MIILQGSGMKEEQKRPPQTPLLRRHKRGVGTLGLAPGAARGGRERFLRDPRKPRLRACAKGDLHAGSGGYQGWKGNFGQALAS
jgi:hypothetical protein